MACIFYNIPYVFLDMPKRLKNYRDAGRENEYILQDTKQKRGIPLREAPKRLF